MTDTNDSNLMGRRWRTARLLTLTVLAFSCAFAAIVSTSLAATIIPTTAAHAQPEDAYNNWSYLISSTGAATVDVWKYTGVAATPWERVSLDTGASVYLYPWGGGWMWGWRSGVWYAILNTQAAKWSCGALSGVDPSLFAKTFRAGVPLLKYNAATSANVGTMSVYDDLDLLCANGFRDAAGSTKVYVLAMFSKRNYCAVFTWECVLAPPASSTLNAYVDVTTITDDVVAPPLGTFPNLPAGYTP